MFEPQGATVGDGGRVPVEQDAVGEHAGEGRAAQVVGAMQSAKGLLDGASSALSGGLSGASAALWSARAATQALDGAREAVSRIAGMAALRSASAWLT